MENSKVQRSYEEKTSISVRFGIQSELLFGVPLLINVKYGSGSKEFGGEIYKFPVSKIKISSENPNYAKPGKDLEIKVINTTDDSKDSQIIFHSLRGQTSMKGLVKDHNDLVGKMKKAYFKGKPVKLKLRH